MSGVPKSHVPAVALGREATAGRGRAQKRRIFGERYCPTGLIEGSSEDGEMHMTKTFDAAMIVTTEVSGPRRDKTRVKVLDCIPQGS